VAQQQKIGHRSDGGAKRGGVNRGQAGQLDGDDHADEIDSRRDHRGGVVTNPLFEAGKRFQS
jgi:hypothetical protein